MSTKATDIDETDETAVDELEDVDLGEVETKKGKTKAAPAKTKAAAKKAKGGPKAAVAASAKKAAAKNKPAKAEDDDIPCPKAVGPHWPYRAGSQRRRVFQLMYEGILKTEFSKECKKLGVNERALLKSMRGPAKRVDHQWKLNEAGERYKIYDVVYTAPKAGKVKEKPALKTVTAKPKKKAVAVKSKKAAA